MELKQLYREIVNEHNLRPVHRGKLENSDLVMRGINPSCGDDITLQLKIENGVITDGKYVGSGCAISGIHKQIRYDRWINTWQHLNSAGFGQYRGHRSCAAGNAFAL